MTLVKPSQSSLIPQFISAVWLFQSVTQICVANDPQWYGFRRIQYQTDRTLFSIVTRSFESCVSCYEDDVICKTKIIKEASIYAYSQINLGERGSRCAISLLMFNLALSSSDQQPKHTHFAPKQF